MTKTEERRLIAEYRNKLKDMDAWTLLSEYESAPESRSYYDNYFRLTKDEVRFEIEERLELKKDIRNKLAQIKSSPTGGLDIPFHYDSVDQLAECYDAGKIAVLEELLGE